MAIETVKIRSSVRLVYRQKHVLWLGIWIGGLGALWLWDLVFLNAPALGRVQSAFANSALTGVIAISFALALGWLTGIGLEILQTRESKALFLTCSLVTNTIRSVPQIILMFVGYSILTILLHEEIVRSALAQLFWIAAVTAVAVFLEIADTISSRIEYFRSLEFVDAMLSCGISEARIINMEILWKNSRTHLLHKLIAMFGVSIFLQCSIDFIVSVGLTTDVSLSNFPLTLGSLLATVDSKQDILAVSNLFTNPAYLPLLFVRHLQGISVAFCIVFSLLCIYNIANGYERTHRLA